MKLTITVLCGILAVALSAKTKPECKSSMKTCMKDFMKNKMMKKAEKMKKVMEPCKTAGECICPWCTKKAMKKSIEAQCPDVDLEFLMVMKMVKKGARVMKYIEPEDEDNMELIKNSMTLHGVSCMAKKFRKVAPMLCKTPEAALECAAPIMGEKAKNALIGIMTGKSVEEEDDEDDGDVLDLGADDEEDTAENARTKRDADSESSESSEGKTMNFLSMMKDGRNNLMKMITFGSKMAKKWESFKRTPVYKQCNSQLDSECQTMMEQVPTPMEMKEKMDMIDEKMSAICNCMDSLDGEVVIKTITDECGAPGGKFDVDRKVEWMKKKLNCKYFQ